MFNPQWSFALSLSFNFTNRKYPLSFSVLCVPHAPPAISFALYYPKYVCWKTEWMMREERTPTRCNNIDDLLSIVDVDYRQHLQLTINHLYCCILLVFFLHALLTIHGHKNIKNEWCSSSCSFLQSFRTSSHLVTISSTPNSRKLSSSFLLSLC